MTLWWLSFADASLPTGSQFLGACIVAAETPVAAIKIAHSLGINPGGEVVWVAIPPDRAPLVEAHWRERLLTRRETDDLNREVLRKLPS